MKPQATSLWSSLLAAGLVEGTEPESIEPTSPWYVKTLLAFSAWLAALFLLGFIGTTFLSIIEHSLASLITGGVMIFAAFKLLNAPRSEFYEHLSLALSLAGQMLVTWAIFKFTGGLSSNATSAPWLLTALLQTGLAIVMPNFTHRVFSAFIAAFTLANALAIMGAPYVFNGIIMFAVAWLWLNEFRYPQHLQKIQAIGYGLVLALLSMGGSVVQGHDAADWLITRGGAGTVFQPWMSDLLIGGVMLYVVWELLQRYRQTVSRQQQIGILFAALLLAAASLKAPGISASLTLLLLGFAGSNRTLQGLGIVSLLFYISSYYYFLDITLLAKALNLFIIGLILLAMRGLILQIKPKNRRVKNA